jgi:hypothetical protein
VKQHVVCRAGVASRSPSSENLTTSSLATPGKSCRLRWSMQHLLAIYSLESRSLRFFLGVDSRIQEQLDLVELLL